MYPFISCMVLLLLTACSPVKTQLTNQYKLEHFARHVLSKKASNQTILVSQPEALSGYQTEQMMYKKRPFEIQAFAKNAWISSPATMLYPLMVQSLQYSHYFFAVTSGVYAESADYRLDTQLIEFQQNFIVKPSVFELVLKASLTRIEDARLIASKLFVERIPCTADTPYAGVIAANKATALLTAALNEFVMYHVKKKTHSEQVKTVVQ